MADKKISELNEKVTAIAADYMALVDSEEAPDETKRITIANLRTGINLATDPTWAAKGDLAVATANDAAGVLTVGSTGQLLTVTSGTPAWTSIGTVMVAASDATAAEKAQALASGGAVCDGTADHTEINAAIAANKVVILSSGNFVGGRITKTANYVFLKGQGIGITIYTLANTTNDDCIFPVGTNWSIEDFTLDCNQVNQGAGSYAGIGGYSCTPTDVYVNNVRIVNARNGIFIRNTTGFHLGYIEVASWLNNGVLLNGTTNKGFINELRDLSTATSATAGNSLSIDDTCSKIHVGKLYSQKPSYCAFCIGESADYTTGANASSAGAGTTMTSATEDMFESSVVGDVINVTGGTNAIVGEYYIAALIDHENITLDRNWCTGAVTADGTFTAVHEIKDVTIDYAYATGDEMEGTVARIHSGNRINLGELHAVECYSTTAADGCGGLIIAGGKNIHVGKIFTYHIGGPALALEEDDTAAMVPKHIKIDEIFALDSGIIVGGHTYDVYDLSIAGGQDVEIGKLVSIDTRGTNSLLPIAVHIDDGTTQLTSDIIIHNLYTTGSTTQSVNIAGGDRIKILGGYIAPKAGELCYYARDTSDSVIENVTMAVGASINIGNANVINFKATNVSWDACSADPSVAGAVGAQFINCVDTAGAVYYSGFADDTAGGTNGSLKPVSSNVVYDHGVATTGVHGVGAGTIAKTTDFTGGFTLTGAITANEDATFKLLPSVATDHHFNGLTRTCTAGETVAIGNLCYMKSDGKFWLAKADAYATTAGQLVIATAAANADATFVGLLYGYFLDATQDYTVGGEVWISKATAGLMTKTQPTTPAFLRCIGYGDDDTDTIFFNPSGVVVEI